MKFSKLAKESLKFYVYGLLDPTDNSIFYVGKASANNRAFDHFKPHGDESKKLLRINDIKSSGKEVKVEILRYGLDSEKTAFEIEAAIIDAIGIENLTNEIRGHGILRGRRDVKEIERLHGSLPIKVSTISEKCMLFFIQNTYSSTLTEPEIYDCTRQFWQGVSKYNRDNLDTKIALAIVEGVVVRVYSIAAWFSAGTTMSSRKFGDANDKWEFVGQIQNEHPLLGRLLVNDDLEPISSIQKGYSYLPRKKA
jgi:hypothetical protein